MVLVCGFSENLLRNESTVISVDFFISFSYLAFFRRSSEHWTVGLFYFIFSPSLFFINYCLINSILNWEKKSYIMHVFREDKYVRDGTYNFFVLLGWTTHQSRSILCNFFSRLMIFVMVTVETLWYVALKSYITFFFICCGTDLWLIWCETKRCDRFWRFCSGT